MTDTTTTTTDVEDIDEPAERMTPFDFACKVDWEGGIFAALEYGLHATDLDPDDPASAKLRDAWADLERVHRDVLAPAVQAVRDELEKISDENGGTPGMSDLFTVLAVDAAGGEAHVEIHTSVEAANGERDALVDAAALAGDTADFRVYQLVEPGSVPGELVFDAEPRLDLGQQIRLEAARIAAGLHAEVGIDEHEHPVLTASEFAAFIADGTVPPDEDAEPTPPDIVVRRTNSGPRTVEILVDGEMVARTHYGEGGWSGMDAFDRAATAIAAALDCPVRREGPEA